MFGDKSYKMTNCPVILETKEFLSTDKYQFKNRESPKKMGKTGLREQLPSSGKRLVAVLRHENN